MWYNSIIIGILAFLSRNASTTNQTSSANILQIFYIIKETNLKNVNN